MLFILGDLFYSGQVLWVVSAVVFVVVLLLAAYIILQLNINKNKELRRNHIREEWNNILAGLLMDETVLDNEFALPKTFTAGLKKRFVRSVLASELVRTRQSLRGNMAETAVAVYNQLGLAANSGRLLKSTEWHRKAKGIQQLSIMEQQQYFRAITTYINHPNIWVRNEAHLGMLRLRGAKGLQFLSHLRYPLSEWHQYNLLHQLQLMQSKSLPGLGAWLLSKNHSVVVFSIRLCQIYQSFEHAAQIGKLQKHTAPAVRAAAAECMVHWGLGAEEPAVVLYQNIAQTQTA